MHNVVLIVVVVGGGGVRGVGVGGGFAVDFCEILCIYGYRDRAAAAAAAAISKCTVVFGHHLIERVAETKEFRLNSRTCKDKWRLHTNTDDCLLTSCLSFNSLP